MADMHFAVAIEANTMAHCHESKSVSENTGKKHTPCKHMAQCLTDASQEDPLQKPVPTVIAEFSTLNAYFEPSISHNIYAASSESPAYQIPPPILFSYDIEVYITKSSFLI
jgi:hypothetical protein